MYHLQRSKIKVFTAAIARAVIGMLSMLLACHVITNAAGGLDPTFDVKPFVGSDTQVTAYAVQQDGKIILGGKFSIANGKLNSQMVRLNADGTIDGSFAAPAFAGMQGQPSPVIFDIVLQQDGKIIAGGDFWLVGGIWHPAVVRLNTDGSIDHSYIDTVTAFNSGAGRDLDIQPDGKLIVVGAYYAGGRGGLVRLNTNGFIDQTFNAGSIRIATAKVLPDGKILASNPDDSTGQTGFVRRYNSDGSPDATFQTLFSGGGVAGIALLPKGKFFLYGTFTHINNIPAAKGVKINDDGTLDSAFNSGGSGFDFAVNDVLVENDGQIVAAGFFDTYNGTAKPRVVRLNADGSLDNSFTYTPVNNPRLYRVFLTPGGQYMITGQMYRQVGPSPTGHYSGFAQRLNNDGGADNSFALYTGGGTDVRALARQSDGKVLAGGAMAFEGNRLVQYLVRYDANGNLDTSFTPNLTGLGSNSGLWAITALAVQPDNKILLFGPQLASGAKQRLIRLNNDGTTDNSFTASLSAGKVVNEIYVLPDGKIFLVGSLGSGIEKLVIKLNADGSQDNSFTMGDSVGFGSKILIQPDGKIILAGNYLAIGGTPRLRVARLNADGSLDASFNPLGGVDDKVFSAGLQPDGKVLIGGNFSNVNGVARKYIARLNPDGSLDTSFVVTGWTAPPITQQGPGVFSLKILPNGKILIGGGFLTVEGQPRNNIARLNSNGSLDTAFSIGAGFNNNVMAMLLQPDGKILAGGNFTLFNNTPRLGVARLFNSGSQFDFDGDGRADLGVFRQSDGNWFLSQSTDGFAVRNFGTNGDLITPADFDGDGKTDLSIYRNGAWWYINSSNGSLGLVNWGAAGDIPLPSDFDGDGKADFIYYTPSTGGWFRAGSTGITSNVQFGIAGDIPVIADMDGDGKADPTIFRPASGVWWYLSSATGTATPVQWGQNGDVPVAGDYDGDGKTDLAVWRPSNGAWYIYNSGSGSVTIFSWGLAADRPVAADYDGDGKTDIAVYRPSTGVWFIMQSIAGFTGMQYGISTDKPVPNAYIY